MRKTLKTKYAEIQRGKRYVWRIYYFYFFLSSRLNYMYFKYKSSSLNEITTFEERKKIIEFSI